MAFFTKHSAGSPRNALVLATIALTINFWAWSLLGPLGSKYASDLSLTPLKLSMLLAIPIIIGSLGRIIMGGLADRYGGRKVFATLCFLSIVPVVMLAFANTYPSLLLAGMLIGISGASFAVGVPFVNAWYPPEKRGFVLGIYSMGNIGVAISGFLTPRLTESFSRQAAYLIVAVFLLLVGAAFSAWGRDAPGWKPSRGSVFKPLRLAAKNPSTWDLSLVYAISFGAFVAFGVYLPVLLKISYGLSLTDAATRAAGFILLATVARPLGGWLSDRFGGARVVRVALVLITALATFVALQPTLAPTTTLAYLSLAVVLGCGNGAVIALVSRMSKAETVGSVTGIVGASGGLGGFLPPLVLGFTYQRTNSYTLALIMLAITSALVFLYINKRIKNSKAWKL